jgi:hypothetical protein
VCVCLYVSCVCVHRLIHLQWQASMICFRSFIHFFRLASGLSTNSIAHSFNLCNFRKPHKASDLSLFVGYVWVRELETNGLNFKESALRTFTFCFGIVLASDKEETVLRVCYSALIYLLFGSLGWATSGLVLQTSNHFFNHIIWTSNLLEG